MNSWHIQLKLIENGSKNGKRLVFILLTRTEKAKSYTVSRCFPTHQEPIFTWDIGIIIRLRIPGPA